jgi:hypothetical protein
MPMADSSNTQPIPGAVGARICYRALLGGWKIWITESNQGASPNFLNFMRTMRAISSNEVQHICCITNHRYLRVSLWFAPCPDAKSIIFDCSIKHAPLHQAASQPGGIFRSS